MEINDNQKIKIVFTGGITVLGGVRIYIDGNKIAKLKNKQEIETYVTPGQHKLNLKDFRFVNSDYILNISTEIKSIYIDLGYYIFGLYIVIKFIFI